MLYCSIVASGPVTRLWYTFFRKGKAAGRAAGLLPMKAVYYTANRVQC